MSDLGSLDYVSHSCTRPRFDSAHGGWRTGSFVFSVGTRALAIGAGQPAQRYKIDVVRYDAFSPDIASVTLVDQSL